MSVSTHTYSVFSDDPERQPPFEIDTNTAVTRHFEKVFKDAGVTVNYDIHSQLSPATLERLDRYATNNVSSKKDWEQFRLDLKNAASNLSLTIHSHRLTRHRVTGDPGETTPEQNEEAVYALNGLKVWLRDITADEIIDKLTSRLTDAHTLYRSSVKRRSVRDWTVDRVKTAVKEILDARQESYRR